MTNVRWAFFERDAEVELFSDKIAYSWGCLREDDPNHQHVIRCLWVWHKCDQNLNPEVTTDQWKDLYVGWTPTTVDRHALISIEPLHIEDSVFWPRCCGMHGFIRDGKWIDV